MEFITKILGLDNFNFTNHYPKYFKTLKEYIMIMKNHYTNFSNELSKSKNKLLMFIFQPEQNNFNEEIIIEE